MVVPFFEIECPRSFVAGLLVLELSSMATMDVYILREVNVISLPEELKLTFLEYRKTFKSKLGLRDERNYGKV